MPRLDLVASLAKMLEWPIGELAEAIWIDGPNADPIDPSDRRAASHDLAADSGDSPDARRHAPTSAPRARTEDMAEGPLQRALRAAAIAAPGTGRGGSTQPDAAIVVRRECSETSPSPSFAELDLRACNAHRRGDPGSLYRIAKAMAAIARSPDERAIAANREAGAWDLRGRYAESMRAIRYGLEETALRSDIRLTLEANLANAHYALWHLVEANALATRLIEGFALSPPKSRLERVVAAFVRYVRGNAVRRSIAEPSANGMAPSSPPSSPPVRRLTAIDGAGPPSPDGGERQAAHRSDRNGLDTRRGARDAPCAAERAVRDLERAHDEYRRLFEEYRDPSYDAVASTCRGGIIECRVELGDMAPGEAMEVVLDRLAEVADVAELPADDHLESYGWWAIFGCNIALRHLDGAIFHRAMAICTNKAAEIADRLDHWGIRERVFTIEHFQRHRRAAVEAYGSNPDCARRAARTLGSTMAPHESPWLLDTDDLRVLAGTMGRFPAFRETGWRILSTARIADDD